MSLEVGSVKKEFDGHIVLDGVTFTLKDKEVAALVGENGSGKTTLLKIIAGQENPDSGSVRKQPTNLKVAYVPQAPEKENDLLTPADMGVSLAALRKMGISHLEDSVLQKFSSGERTKVYLARLISEEADLLLLDEPTNHLDIEALEWLENYLAVDYKGSILLVSHDRRFMDNLAQKTLELQNGKIKVYGGNYSFYREQKAIEEEAQRRAYIVQQKKVKRINEEIREVKASVQVLESRTTGTDHYVRRKAAKAAKGALAMARRLEKELTESGVPKPEPDFELSVIFKPRIESGKVVLFTKGLIKSFDERGLLEPINMVVERGDRVALLGPNGSGKTTLIKLILGEEKQDSGTIEIGNNVQMGYLPQEQKIVDSDSIVIEDIVASTKLDKTSAYKLIRRFLFSDDDLRTPIASLSSGQKSRLALAKIMASGSNFIILDEPTNHLDLPSREALETAVESYPGTLLIVSHDRYFLERVKPNKIIYL